MAHGRAADGNPGLRPLGTRQQMETRARYVLIGLFTLPR